MVSTRRQSQGLQEGDAATLTLRSKQSPPQTEAKVLRDGTVHGEAATPTDRPSKRRRTRGAETQAGNSTDIDSSFISQPPSDPAPNEPESAGGDTKEPAKQPAQSIENGEPLQTTPGKRKRTSTKSKTAHLNKQKEPEPASEPMHHRFDSAEPEAESNIVQSAPADENHGEEDDENDDNDDNDDEAPEQVHTISNSLVHGLPSSLTSSKPPKKSKKKRPHVDEKPATTLITESLTTKPENRSLPEEPSQNPRPGHLLFPLNDNSTTTTHPNPKPKPRKPIKDTYDPHTQTLTRHFPSTITSTSSSPFAKRQQAGHLPQKISKPSVNMREQLLHRKQQHQKGGKIGGFGAGGGGGGGGFFVRR